MRTDLALEAVVFQTAAAAGLLLTFGRAMFHALDRLAHTSVTALPGIVVDNVTSLALRLSGRSYEILRSATPSVAPEIDARSRALRDFQRERLEEGRESLAVFASYTHRVIDDSVPAEYPTDQLLHGQPCYALRVRLRGATKLELSELTPAQAQLAPIQSLAVERNCEAVWRSGDKHVGHISIVRLGPGRGWIATELHHTPDGSHTCLVWLPNGSAFDSYEWDTRGARSRAMPEDARNIWPIPSTSERSTIFGVMRAARSSH